MKIAVISDIHANLPAFEAVLIHLDSLAPDVVIVGGDTINRGPQPLACLKIVLDRIQNAGWKVIRGNHEDYVLRAAREPLPAEAWQQEVIAHTLWTAVQVEHALDVIAAWPDHCEVAAPDGSRVSVFHASRQGNRIGVYESMNEEELLAHATAADPVLCVGHTHIPFIRKIQGKLIVNAGAVGMPFDHDHRASFALLTWSPAGWSAETVRVPYDRDATIRAYVETGYLLKGGPMVELILMELERAEPKLGAWHRHYEQRVACGEISIRDSIGQLLRRPAEPFIPNAS